MPRAHVRVPWTLNTLERRNRARRGWPPQKRYDAETPASRTPPTMGRMTSPEQRAAAILGGQRFVVLGTADADGPWTAAAQYRLLPRGLYVESDVSSRHARAIAASGVASGVVFDSSAAPADADGVQLAFAAREVDAEASAIRDVLGARLPRDAGDDDPATVLAAPTKRLYVLAAERAFVFDRDAWRSRGTDARLEVDVAEVWAQLATLGR